MSYPVPTQFELRCSGYSLIISQIIWALAAWLQSIDYDYHDVQNEQEVLELHNIVSSDIHRLEIEISCVLLWISFPFLLAALYGIKKLWMATFYDTPGELLMYIGEKAYILYIGLMLLLVPAISLVSVSYDWSFKETTIDSNVIPSGYWIQLYTIIFQTEIVDCLAVADATFMLSYFLVAAYLFYAANNGNKKFKQFEDIIHQGILFKKLKYCAQTLIACFCVSLFIIFIIVLLEFAESGFFSPSGYAGFLVIWSFIAKIFIGFRCIQTAKAKTYNQIKRVLSEKSNDETQQSLNYNDLLTNSKTNYQMEQINIDIDQNGNDENLTDQIKVNE